MCGVNLEDKTSPKSVYFDALIDLSVLLQVEQVSMRDFALLMAFQGRLSGEFRKLLLVLDSRALLIMLYWLVLLDGLDLWWTKTRSQCEAGAILRYLSKSSDLRIQEMLEVPRLAFGEDAIG